MRPSQRQHRKHSFQKHVPTYVHREQNGSQICAITGRPLWRTILLIFMLAHAIIISKLPAWRKLNQHSTQAKNWLRFRSFGDNYFVRKIVPPIRSVRQRNTIKYKWAITNVTCNLVTIPLPSDTDHQFVYLALHKSGGRFDRPTLTIKFCFSSWGCTVIFI